MTQQTPIVTLFQTCNFADEANKTGKVIDFSNRNVLTIFPEEKLALQLRALGGHVEKTNNYIRVFLPFDFSQTPPVTPVSLLPTNLLFYLRPQKRDELKLSGLDLGKHLLFVAPSAVKADYTFQNATIECVPCCTGTLIGADDIVQPLAADLSLDNLQAVIEKPLGTKDRLLDLKVKIGTTVTVVEKDADLLQLQRVLRENLWKRVSISFSRSSKNELLKPIPNALITETPLPPDVVGVVNIPVSALKTNEQNKAKYAALNRFILHLPLFQFTVALNLNTALFNGGSKLLFDEKEIGGVEVKNHPQMPGLKQVSATVNNYTAFLSRRKQVVIQNEKRKHVFPVDPLRQLDPATNTATITITT